MFDQSKEDAPMFYAKTLPIWERAVRLVCAIVMALCSWQYGPSPLGVVFGVSAAVTALTAAVGFCPMCALAGRRPKTQRD